MRVVETSLPGVLLIEPEVFRDARFGRSHPAPEQASRISHAALQAGPSGNYDTEEHEHKRMRRVLATSSVRSR